MIEFKVNNGIKQYAWNLVKTGKLRRNEILNATDEQHYAGIIGETVVCDLFRSRRPLGDGPDLGFDLVIGGHRVDVKTMLRTCDPRPEFVNNIQERQSNNSTDFYLFCSLNKRTSVLTICGLAKKTDIPILGERFSVGDKRPRTDGTEIEVVTPLWEIPNSKLHPVHSKKDIENVIQSRSCEDIEPERFGRKEKC